MCIQARRCTDNNRALYKQTWVLQPSFLLWIINRLKDRSNKLQSKLYDLKLDATFDMNNLEINYTPFDESLVEKVNKRQLDFSAFHSLVDSYRGTFDKTFHRLGKLIAATTFLQGIANCIGFREIRFFDEGNTERSLNPFKGRGFMVFPCSPSCFYDDHASLTLNPSLFKDLDSLIVNDVSLDGWSTKRYSPSDRPLPMAKQKDEKTPKSASKTE